MHAHPFTAGEDFCLVHNGSLSNYHMIRRRLEVEGGDLAQRPRIEFRVEPNQPCVPMPEEIGDVL